MNELKESKEIDNLVNMLEYDTQHITIEEFIKNYERVGWVEYK